MKKTLFLGLLVAMLIGLSGCTQDPGNAVRLAVLQPEGKEFMEKYPEAKVDALFLSKDAVKLMIEDIEEDCGQKMQLTSYWYITMKKGSASLEMYTDEGATKVLCVIKKEPEQPPEPPPEPPPPEPPPEPEEDECTYNADCDDNFYCTSDICSGSPKACSNEPITSCRSGDRCCPADCNISNDSDCDECQSPSDCDDQDISTVDRCAGSPKRCTHREKTCDDRRWWTCDPPLTCPVDFIPASDTDKCCPMECDCNGIECGPNQECTTAGCALIKCSKFGEECEQNETCTGPIYQASDATECCYGLCERAS